uniref:acid phosphatase n=1 Tax=Palpitomonas bilix TaxID=652834 RepID=A0A7S3DKM9_9EUKA|mmetsp:Transcript_42296/g.108889  ORF Transcript_42296/g.108889 Transcript_42296/m.108889 type:complete len:326 (+) Transcript_42296:52-1029(+)
MNSAFAFALYTILCFFALSPALPISLPSQQNVRGANSGSFTFFLLGDWGGQTDAPYTTKIQLDVAKQMIKKAGSLGFAPIVISVGDNFYKHGLPGDISSDDTQTRFTETFQKVYPGDSLGNDWYLVPGNHDYEGNLDALLAYHNYDSRWNFPSLNYTFTLDTDAGSVQFVMIDTIKWCDQGFADQSIAWVEGVLASSTADWIFAVGHYPVYSAGHNGPYSDLISGLKPLLEKYNVIAYLSGHDHVMQHIDVGSSVQYIGSGSGMEYSTSTKHEKDLPSGSLKYLGGKNGGFGVVTLDGSAQSMQVDFINGKGNTKYTMTASNPKA